MKSNRTPQLSLIVAWPNAVAAAIARQATRRLIESRVRTTWAVEQAPQIEALASWGALRAGMDAALRFDSQTDLSGDDNGRELSRRLVLMRATGLDVDVVLGPADLSGAAGPRMLRGLGVNGVVVEGADRCGAARALPFGVWQFTPRIVVPRPRTWTNWFRPRRPLLDGPTASPVLAIVDLGRLGDAASRAWRDAETTIDEALAAAASSQAKMVTVSELAAQMTRANAPRPQRSILRSAA